ncbi:hypothetical protein POM88_033904 [Heracleum sosnowskyi]|uniref:DUF7769 domain-containing protein n=1 Tax=Heracleum sosnowskyi TaxID=360622 RepID=A0AAD8HKF4_9APIA|nr:hypothetical protein POM88_033904 [Heracleum sosnowskyi]
MSFMLNLDLNLPPREDESNEKEMSTHVNEEHSDDIHLFDLNIGEQVESEGRQARKNRMLSNAERRSIYLALLSKSNNGKLKKGSTKVVAIMFSISTRTVTRIWKQSKTPLANGVVDVSHQKTKNCGRKRIQFDPELFRSIPLSPRTSLESLAATMKMSSSTLNHNVQSGKIRRHTNPIKPLERHMFRPINIPRKQLNLNKSVISK